MMVGALRASILLAVATQGLGQNNQGYGNDGYGDYDSYGGYGGGYGAAPTPPPPTPAPAPPTGGGILDVFNANNDQSNDQGPTPPPTTPAPEIRTTPPESETGPGPTLSPSTVTHDHCHMVVPPECVFPFYYKSLKYTTCTGVDAMETMWCSTTSQYAGKWKQCKDPCKNKWPVKAIAGAVVAGGVAATGIGLIAAAVEHNKKNGKITNPFALGETGIPKAAKAAPVAVAAAPVPAAVKILVPATPGHPGLEEKIVSVPARLLETKTFLPQQAATMGAAEADKRLAGIIVLAAFVICSVGVALYAGFSRKKRVHAQPDEKNEQAYLQIAQ